MTNLNLENATSNESGSEPSVNETAPLDLSDEAYTALNMFFNCFFIGLAALCGIIGNVLNIVVLSKHSMNNTTNIILFYLSISDLMLSILTAFVTIGKIIYYFDTFLSATLDSVFLVCFLPIRTLSVFISTYLVTLLSVERMIAVCFPFHVASLVTASRLKFTVIILLTMLTCFVFPSYSFYSLSLFSLENVTYIKRDPTLYFLDNYDFFIGFFFSTFINIYSMAIPLVVVSFSSIITLTKVAIASKKFNTLSAQTMAKRNKEMRSVKTSLLLSFLLIFVVLVPVGIIDTIYMANYALFNLSIKSITFLISSEKVLYQLNSSLNFVVYVTTSSKYSQILRNMFRFNWNSIRSRAKIF